LIFLASYNANRKKDFTKGRNALDTFTESPLKSSARSLTLILLM
jgi:hypothetical protein